MPCCGQNNRNRMENMTVVQLSVDNDEPVLLRYMARGSQKRYIGHYTGYLYLAGGPFKFVWVHPQDATYFLNMISRGRPVFTVANEDDEDVPAEMRRQEIEASSSDANIQEATSETEYQDPFATAEEVLESFDIYDDEPFDFTTLPNIGEKVASEIANQGVHTLKEFVANGVDWVKELQYMTDVKATEAYDEAVNLLNS